MNKQEEIREFIIPDRQVVRSYTARYLTDDVFRDALSENNVEWSAYHDFERMGLVVSCKNKPRDLLVYGLAWETL